MAANGDPGLDKLIENALEMVSAVESMTTQRGQAEPLQAASEPAPEMVAGLLAPVGSRNDGYAEITVAGDRMTVEASFYPPQGGGESLTLGDVQTLLRKRGVVYGIDWTVITDALDRCNTNHSPQVAVVIARGDPPSDEVPEHVVIDPVLLAEPRPPVGDRAVDYRAISPFHFVTAGQVLGRIASIEPGVLGTDVLGAAVQYRKRRSDGTRTGQNVVVQGGNVVAGRDGRFLLTAGVATVSDVLKIAGDVDYATGHVDFPGDVVVVGQVKQGFKIRAAGSLVVGGVISASEVLVGDDLVAQYGILGRGTGLVRARGCVQTGFIENCYVEAYKAIHVRTGCLNAFISTLDRLDTGNRGVIVGGTVVAQNGVQAANIGSESGSRTEIRCGIDFLVTQKLEWIRDKSVALALKLREIERLASAKGGSGDRVEAARQKLRGAIRALAATARSLAAGLDRNEAAEVVVTGTIYPGAYVEICRVPYAVDRPLRAVRIGLSKQEGRVVARPLR